jgi:hypothetical protein
MAAVERPIYPTNCMATSMIGSMQTVDSKLTLSRDPA